MAWGLMGCPFACGPSPPCEDMSPGSPYKCTFTYTFIYSYIHVRWRQPFFEGAFRFATCTHTYPIHRGDSSVVPQPLAHRHARHSARARGPSAGRRPPSAEREFFAVSHRAMGAPGGPGDRVVHIVFIACLTSLAARRPIHALLP